MCTHGPFGISFAALFWGWVFLDVGWRWGASRAPARATAGGRLLRHGAGARWRVGLSAALAVLAALSAMEAVAGGDVLHAVFSGAVGLFALAAVMMSWESAFTLRVVLRHDGIAISSVRRGLVTVRWEEVSKVDAHPYTGHLELHTTGGRRVRISDRLAGIGELAAAVQQHVARSAIEAPAWEKLTKRAQTTSLPP
jgi:hypothetical protein